MSKRRIDALMHLSRETGLTLDYWEWLTRGLDSQALRKLRGNASALPQYMKSSDSPYTRRSSSAPLSDSLDEPVSQFPND